MKDLVVYNINLFLKTIAIDLDLQSLTPPRHLDHFSKLRSICIARLIYSIDLPVRQEAV